MLLKGWVIVNQPKRSRLSAAQTADVLRRWKAGESLHEIGRAYNDGSINLPPKIGFDGGYAGHYTVRWPELVNTGAGLAHRTLAIFYIYFLLFDFVVRPERFELPAY